MCLIDILYIRFKGESNMRVAIIGSRGIQAKDLTPYLPADTTAIVSGGARGVDACARAYALAHGLPLTEFLPDYRRYGKAAPLKRNQQIIDHADYVVALWDGHSHGTEHAIGLCQRRGVPLRVFLCT